jgi:DNA-binding Lrp family transcriptional regulator
VSERPFTADEWLAALQEAMRPVAAGGQTVRDLSEATGMNEKAIRPLIAKLQAQGRVIAARVQREAIDGARRWVPVYSLKGDAPQGEAN